MTKKCKYCAMMVPVDAVICPYCRKKIGMTRAGKVIAALFILVVISAIASKSNTPPLAPPSPEEVKRYSESKEHDDAVYMSKEFITEQLKAPSTAKFPSIREFSAVKKNGFWDVLGYVDSQNSYGVMLRTQFLCTLQKRGDTWFMLDLKMPY